MLAAPGNHAVAARGIIAATCGQIAQRVGAVKRIIQAAPAGVGGVQGKPRVHDRHHKLRSGDRSDFGIDVLGLDAEIRTFVPQIADLAQECGVGVHILRLATVGDVVGVNLFLQKGALGQCGAVARPHLGHEGGETAPEGIGADASAV